MRTPLFTTYLFGILLLLGGSEAMAQSGAQMQRCLLATSESTWSTLGLSSDQVRRVGYIQVACREACEAAGVDVKPNPISDEDGESIMEELRGVLSAEQFDGWVAYCATVEK